MLKNDRIGQNDNSLLPDNLLAYCKQQTNLLIVVVFPIAMEKTSEINRVLIENGRIAFQKEISFTELGQYNLIRLLYFNMHWIGAEDEITYGVCHHVDHRFWKKGPVLFYFVEFFDPTRVLEVKTLLRSLFEHKNFSIHINDTHEETMWIAEHILIPQSIYFINHAQPWLSKKFARVFQKFRLSNKVQSLNKNDICIVGRPVMASFGLQDAEYVEYITLGEDAITRMDNKTEIKKIYLPANSNLIEKIILDPDLHFYYQGFKFSSHASIYGFLNDEKSTKRANRLFNTLNPNSINLFRMVLHIKFRTRILKAKISHFKIHDLSNLLPPFARLFVKKGYHMILGRLTIKDD